MRGRNVVVSLRRKRKNLSLKKKKFEIKDRGRRAAERIRRERQKKLGLRIMSRKEQTAKRSRKKMVES